MCHLQPWAAKLRGQWKCSCWCKEGEEVKGKRRAQRPQRVHDDTGEACIASRATRGMSFMPRSVPAPAIIHPGGLVFLWKGNDNGRSPTHWNFAQGSFRLFLYVKVVSQYCACFMVLEEKFSFFPTSYLDLPASVVSLKIILTWFLWFQWNVWCLKVSFISYFLSRIQRFFLPLDREYQLAPLVIPSSKKSPQFQPLCIQLWAYE